MSVSGCEVSVSGREGAVWVPGVRGTDSECVALSARPSAGDFVGFHTEGILTLRGARESPHLL